MLKDELERLLDGDRKIILKIISRKFNNKELLDERFLMTVKNILDDKSSLQNSKLSDEVIKYSIMDCDESSMERFSKAKSYLHTYKKVNNVVRQKRVQNIQNINTVINDFEAKYELEDIKYDGSNILNDKEKTINYLKVIVQVLSDIYFFKERYKRLAVEYEKNLNKYFCVCVNIEENIKIEKYNLENEIKNAEKKINNKPVWKTNIKLPEIVDETVVITRPTMPTLKKITAFNQTQVEEENKKIKQLYEEQMRYYNQKCSEYQKIGKPIFTITKPVEPVLEKPGLFNKNKINEQNKKLQWQYELNMNWYNQKCEEYIQSIEKFKNDYKNKMESLAKVEYESKLALYEKDLGFWKSVLTTKTDRLEMLQKDETAIKNEKIEKTEVYQKLKAIEYELEFIVDNIEKNIKLEKELYSYNIVYGKYRNIIAISSFLDYLISGRCSTLAETDGAYNLYEQESRTDTIINKMDVLIDSLSQIKENQYYIYNQLDSINKSLNIINESILVNNHLQTVEIGQLNEVIDKADQIAYNTKVESYYAKKNSNYSKALAFIQLLK